MLKIKLFDFEDWLTTWSSFFLIKESSFLIVGKKNLQCTLIILSLCVWSDDVRC